MGRQDTWDDFLKRDNLVLRSGRWGSQDFYLADYQYTVDPATDLLLHFDRRPFQDLTGHYSVLQEAAILSAEFTKLGPGSSGFSGRGEGVTLRPRGQALFSGGLPWEDFSIEFWLYPALLSDGEVVLSWQGSRWREEQLIPQSVLVNVVDRRLHWSFENFFVPPDGEERLYTLAGIVPLVPRRWHHHLIRYDSRRGMLQYLVDGIPEAILHTTDTGSEGGSLDLPLPGQAGQRPMSLGPHFTGFIDELRILKRFEERPVLSRYSGRPGYAESRVFDLGLSGTRLKRIDSVFRTPADSAVYFYYRTADRLQRANQLPSAWTQFLPGTDFSKIRGRYLQIRVELMPDGSRMHSPELSELRVTYEQDLPPAPPAGMRAIPGNRRVALRWEKVAEEDLGGYLLYYGTVPGQYNGTEAEQGRSPIDVGDVAEFELSGLTNGVLYYFSVAAYDTAHPAHRSLFSSEVGARPSGLLE